MRKLSNQIDQLFAELIHDPWRRGRSESPTPASERGEPWVIDVPVDGITDGEVAVAIDGNRLTLSVFRTDSPQSEDQPARPQCVFRQSFALPGGTRLCGLQLTYQASGMRVRVQLES